MLHDNRMATVSKATRLTAMLNVDVNAAIYDVMLPLTGQMSQRDASTFNKCESGITLCVAGQECANKTHTHSCTNTYDSYGKSAEVSHKFHPLAI